MIDQAPVERALATDTFLDGAEIIRPIAAHAALVDQARETACARQYREQGQFGQGHGACAIIGQDDFVARKREFVAAARARAFDRGNPGLAGMGSRVLDAVAGLVGELAEVHFVRMRGAAEHLDVGAGTEHARMFRVHDHATHFGMLEAQALDRVVEFDVDAEIVGIELELVAAADNRLFVDGEAKPGDRAADLE